jgi:hypothetical protein
MESTSRRQRQLTPQSRRQSTGIAMGSPESMLALRHSPQPLRANSDSLLDNLDLSKSRVVLIRDAAYERFARRGFTPGHELEDWLAAEQQVDEFLAREIPVGFYG